MCVLLSPCVVIIITGLIRMENASQSFSELLMVTSESALLNYLNASNGEGLRESVRLHTVSSLIELSRPPPPPLKKQRVAGAQALTFV